MNRTSPSFIFEKFEGKILLVLKKDLDFKQRIKVHFIFLYV